MTDVNDDDQVCFIYWLREGAGAEYDRMHREAWPEVRANLDARGAYDYSIFRRGDLVISTLRRPPGVTAGSGEKPPRIAEWQQLLRPLFSQIADLDGEPLYAERIFRHEGHPRESSPRKEHAMTEHFVHEQMVTAGPYSHVVRHGDTVYTAGCGPHEPGTGKVVAGGIREQTQATLDNVERALALAGASLADVVKFTVYLQNLHEDKDGMNEVFTARLAPPFPVRTTVGADLMNILVEIDAVAVIRQSE